MQLRIHRFLPVTTVEGPGKRACIWVQGCSLQCKGCAVPEMWAKNGGFDISVEELASKILNGPRIEGVTFAGGEPFEQAEALALLGGILRNAGMSVITFTGMLLEDIEENNIEGYKNLIAITDILIDGPFSSELIDFSRPWVGSSNQRYHFLTDRYKYLEQHLCDMINKFEVRLLPDGRVFLNGMGRFFDFLG